MTSGPSLARDKRPSRKREISLRPEEHEALERLATADGEPMSRVVGKLAIAEVERRGKLRRRREKSR